MDEDYETTAGSGSADPVVALREHLSQITAVSDQLSAILAEAETSVRGFGEPR